MPSKILSIPVEFQDAGKRVIFYEQSNVQAKIKVTFQAQTPIQDGQIYSGATYKKVEKIDGSTIQSTLREGRFLYQANPFKLSHIEGKSTRVFTAQDKGDIVDLTFVDTGVFNDNELEIGLFKIFPKHLFDETLFDTWFPKVVNPLSEDRKTLTFVERNPSKFVKRVITSMTPIQFGIGFEGSSLITIMTRLDTASSVQLLLTKQRVESGMYFCKDQHCVLVTGSLEKREYDSEMTRLVTETSTGLFNAERVLDSYFAERVVPYQCERVYRIVQDGSEWVTKIEKGIFRNNNIVEGRQSKYFELTNDIETLAIHYLGKFLTEMDAVTQTMTAYFNDPKGRLYSDLGHGSMTLLDGFVKGAPLTNMYGERLRYDITIRDDRLQSIICGEIKIKKGLGVLLWHLRVEEHSFVLVDLKKSMNLNPSIGIHEEKIGIFKMIEQDLMELELVVGEQLKNDEGLRDNPVATPAPLLEHASIEELKRVKDAQEALLLEERADVASKKRLIAEKKIEKRRLAADIALQQKRDEELALQQKLAAEQKRAAELALQRKRIAEIAQQQRLATIERRAADRELQQIQKAEKASRIVKCISPQVAEDNLSNQCDKAVQTEPLKPAQPIKLQFVYYPVARLSSGSWIQNETIFSSSPYEKSPSIIVNSQLPDETIDLTFVYPMTIGGTTFYVNKWISNRLGEGGPFFMIMNVWDSSCDQFTQYYVSSMERIKKEHFFNGTVEVTKYSKYVNSASSPVSEVRGEGIFLSHVDYYDQFMQDPFILKDGQLTQITENYMVVQDVNLDENVTSIPRFLPARHNSTYTQCFASFFQPAHVQSGAPTPSILTADPSVPKPSRARKQA